MSPSDGAATLVVMMPALNEEKTVGDMIRRIPRDIEGVGKVRVVVINDGSTDRTEEIARSEGAIVVTHMECLGLGRSFRDGLEASLKAGADVIVNIDSDGQFSPEDIPALISPILDDRADFVTCTRFQRPEFMPQMPLLKKWGNRRMCTIVNFATGRTKLTDVSCGFRAFSREAALHLNLVGRFTYTHESIITLARKDMRIKEVPLKVRGERKHGKSRMANSVVKYGTRAMVIITRAMAYNRPLTFFGGIALGLLLVSALAFQVPLWDWLMGNPRGLVRHRFMLGLSGVALILSFLLGILALVADMLGRQIGISERLLFYHRKGEMDEAGRKALESEDGSGS